MKKMFRLLMILSFLMTIYTMFFWEPKEHNNYNLREKSEPVANSILNNNIDVDGVALKENIQKSIFKVSQDTLKNCIMEEDKIKVDTIINSMSEVDIDRIRKEESNLDKEEGAKKIFKILSTRLQSKEYRIIKNIYDPYIDFTNI